MARDWQSLVQSDDFTDVMRLVHLAMRQTDVEVEAIRGELVKARRRAYESELTLQARRAGCGSRQGRLTAGPALTEMNEESKAEAIGIVNTYNYDLAQEIIKIKGLTPPANRHTYAKRLQAWDSQRAIFKAQQIGTWTEGTARSRALADFTRNNNITGVATLEPSSAAESICQGWINRGEVPLPEAINNPPPYHIGCPHSWRTQPERVPQAECGSLWMGE